MQAIKLQRALIQGLLALALAAGATSIYAQSTPPIPPPSDPISSAGVRGYKDDSDEKTRGAKAAKKADKNGAKANKAAGDGEKKRSGGVSGPSSSHTDQPTQLEKSTSAK
jgi:hypothetical protein